MKIFLISIFIFFTSCKDLNITVGANSTKEKYVIPSIKLTEEEKVMANKILKKGITGFYSRDETPAPSLDKKLIDNISTVLNSQKEITIKNITKPTLTTNYYVFEISDKEIPYYILLNTHYPLIACSDNDNWMGLEFINMDKNLAKKFSDYTVLESDFLNSKVTLEFLANLSEAELSQIKYWESETLGEVIFNGYD